MESDHSLEPHLKAGSHSVTETIPRVFDTKVGRRHVPKWRSPPTPPLEMVESARRGVLKGFFRSGRIQGASPEYVGMANPKTAILTLDDIYEFETRPLESLDQKVAEDARTLQNLFYIALHDAELPSYHFWTEPGDVDPVEAGKETDWGAHFENHPPSPVTTAIIAKLEDERKSRIQHREAGNKVDDSSEGPTNSVVAQAGPQGQQYQSVASGLLHDHLDALQVKEDPLAFLDDYDDVGSAQSVRSRDRTTPEANKSNNSAPNEGIGGRSVLATTTGCTMDNIPKNVQEKSLEAPSSRISTAAQASGASNITSSSTDAVVLLHFNRGGMYLHDFSHQALCNMARWLTNSEEENPPENKNMRMFVDVKERDRDPHVHKLTSSSTSSNRNFHANIKKYLGKPGFTFRVRTESIDTLSPFDVRTTGSLKLVRRNIGYCYVEIDWDKPYQLSQNSQRMEKAIDILFSWELSVDPNPDELFLEIPGHGFFHINRKADLVLGADIQKLFGTITRISSRLGADPTEIILHDSEQYTALMLGPEEEVENDNEVVDTAQPSPAGPQKAPVQKTAKILQPPEASTQPDQKHIARSKPPAAPTNEPRYVEKDDSSAVQHPQIVLHPPPVQGGPDLPAPYLRIVTLSETNKLQERLRKVEAQLAKSEERCQQSEKDHEATLTEMEEHNRDLRMAALCPICQGNWAQNTRQQQIDHINGHQNSTRPRQNSPFLNCSVALGSGSTIESDNDIVKHLSDHAAAPPAVKQVDERSDICNELYCFTDLGRLTKEQQEEHRRAHQLNAETAHNYDLATDDNVQTRRQMMDWKIQCGQWKERFNELESQTGKRIEELESQSKLILTHDKGTQTNSSEPGTGEGADSEATIQTPSHDALWYCNVCLKSVDKQSDDGKAKHAEKCGTNISDFLLWTAAEAKTERKARTEKQKAAKSHAAPSETIRRGSNPRKLRRDDDKGKGPEQSNKAETGRKAGRAVGQNPGDKRLAEDNTDEELELPDAGKKGDRKRAANSKTNQKAQDAGEDDTTIGRRISKRKISTLKPPAEAASDDELGSPKKKRKFTAKVTKSNFEEAASLRRSGRGQGVHKPPAVNEEDEGPEPATGGKRKAEAAAGKTASKKAKTSK